MSEPSHKSRFAIDLDDLERQLRDMQATSARQPEADPLAELARLVGQDDPLKDVFSAGTRPSAQLQLAAQSPANEEFSVPVEDLRGSLDEFDAIFDRKSSDMPQQSVAEPQFAVEDDIAREVMAAITPQQATAAQMPEDPLAALDDLVSRDLDRILMETSPEPAAREAPAGYDAEAAAMAAAGAAIAGAAAMSQRGGGAEAYEDAGFEAEEQPRRRFSKGAMTAVVLIGVGLVGVAGAALWRGGGKSSDGQPRIIAAEPGPSRVQPQNPGGTVVPDQNKQIYERGAPAKPAESAVVNRDEQPVDVQAAVRNQPRVVFPGPGSAQPQDNGQSQGQTPPSAGVTSVLGEPRRVRTIAIRPDGTVVAPEQPVASAPPAAPTTPAAQVTASSPSALQQSQPAAPGGIIRAQAPRPVQAPSTPVAEVPVAPRQTQTVASVPPAPATPVAQPARPAPQPRPAPVAEAPATTGGGGFAVQLAAPGSENEARSLFSSLQRRFPDELGGQRPLIRRAEVNGREVYRLRVGPMSREGAAELCNKLKAKGGQCFLAGA